MPAPEVMGSLIICTAGRTAGGAVDAPGNEAGTARCPTWAPLPKPAATWPPAPSPGIVGGFGTAAAAAAGALSSPVDLAIWVKVFDMPVLKYGRPSVL